MQSQEGVKSVKLSGLRATIVMEDGYELSADKLKEVMSGGATSFVSLEKKDIPVPKAAYVLAVTGAT